VDFAEVLGDVRGFYCKQKVFSQVRRTMIRLSGIKSGGRIQVRMYRSKGHVDLR
jgi:hypothetical protein